MRPLACGETSRVAVVFAEYVNADEVIPKNTCVLAKMKVPTAPTGNYARPATSHWKTAAGGKPPLTYTCSQCGKRGDHLREDCTSVLKASAGAGLPASAMVQITEEQALAAVRLLSCCAAGTVARVVAAEMNPESRVNFVFLLSHAQQAEAGIVIVNDGGTKHVPTHSNLFSQASGSLQRTWP